MRGGRRLDADPQPALGPRQGPGFVPDLVGVGHLLRRRIDPEDRAVTSARHPHAVAGGRERDRLLAGALGARYRHRRRVERRHGPGLGVRDPHRPERECDRGRSPPDGDRLRLPLARDDPADGVVRCVRDPYRAGADGQGDGPLPDGPRLRHAVASSRVDLGHRRVDAVRYPDTIAIGDDRRSARCRRRPFGRPCAPPGRRPRPCARPCWRPIRNRRRSRHRSVPTPTGIGAPSTWNVDGFTWTSRSAFLVGRPQRPGAFGQAARELADAHCAFEIPREVERARPLPPRSSARHRRGAGRSRRPRRGRWQPLRR